MITLFYVSNINLDVLSHVVYDCFNLAIYKIMTKLRLDMINLNGILCLTFLFEVYLFSSFIEIYISLRTQELVGLLKVQLILLKKRIQQKTNSFNLVLYQHGNRKQIFCVLFPCLFLIFYAFTHF